MLYDKWKWLTLDGYGFYLWTSKPTFTNDMRGWISRDAESVSIGGDDSLMPIPQVGDMDHSECIWQRVDNEWILCAEKPQETSEELSGVEAIKRGGAWVAVEGIPEE